LAVARPTQAVGVGEGTTGIEPVGDSTGSDSGPGVLTATDDRR
jgi:hypothetical protein